MRILLLYWHPDAMGPMRVAVWQHLHMLDTTDTRHEIVYYNDNSPNEAPPWPQDINFDAIVLHNTFLGMRWQPWFYPWKEKYTWIRDANCLKIAIPQDEYDHSSVLDEWLFEWDISVILTNFDAVQRKLLYPLMHNKATFYRCFTGYIDEATAQQVEAELLPPAARAYDIVYRATHLPYWFGHHGQLKHQIADIVANRAQALGLKHNISTHPDDVILGDQWFNFLASGRTVIGCESGSSALDRYGEIQAQTQALLQQNPQLSFAEVDAQLPPGWDDYGFFAISPRHFEAVLTKTCQILVEGHYDGVFEPNRHYLPLKRDFSNLNEVLEKIQDHDFIQEMVERAYADIYLSGKYSYRSLAQQLERIILEHQQEIVSWQPVAEQNLNAKKSESLRQSITERHHRLATLLTNLTATQATLKETEAKLGETREQLEALHHQLKETEAELGETREQLAALHHQLEVQRVEAERQYAVLQNEYQIIIQELNQRRGIRGGFREIRRNIKPFLFK